MKKFNSVSYYDEKYVFKNRKYIKVKSTDGYLFTKDGYRTKIKPEDLPEWYVYGYFHKCYCYLSAKGVVDIAYYPNYNNHIHKDDVVLISYNKKIKRAKYAIYCDGFDEFVDYDEKYILAVEKYSGLDLSDIKKAALEKEKWYYENYGD